jgi:GTPase SAR1 family protein
MQRTEALKIHYPSNIIICGATNSGKTILALSLLRNSASIFQPPVHQRFYLYRHYQKSFDAYRDSVQFILDLSELPQDHEPALLVIDDHMDSLTPELVHLFTAGRHRNLSIIFLTQNLYYPDPKTRTINANSCHVVLLKSPRSGVQLQTLSRQYFSAARRGGLMKAFEDATRNRFGYFWINLDPRADTRHTFTSGIIPNPGQYPVVYKV